MRSFKALLVAGVFFYGLAGAKPVRAASITGSCDDRAAGREQCTAWVQENLTALGCFPQGMHCDRHPWGSDFAKSWNCTTQSSNCEVATGESCPSGSVRLFRDGWIVCRKGSPTSFRGECDRENGSHPVLASSCEQAKSSCLSLGGTPSASCQKQGGYWQADCDFREMRIRYLHGSSCEELRDRCERSNSPKGPSGTLTRCLAN